MTRHVYKVCDARSWHEAVAVGSYRGSADDLRDGYIHLSLAHQLEATLCKYFAGRTDLLLVSLDEESLGSALRHEPSRGGDLFPHLYAELDPRLAVSVAPVRWVNGKPVLEGLA